MDLLWHPCESLRSTQQKDELLLSWTNKDFSNSAARSSKISRKGSHQAQTVWHQPVWNHMLTSWPPSSHRSSTDHWSCAKSPHASNACSCSTITGLNDYRPVALLSVSMKSFERLVLAYLKNTTGPLLDPLQFTYRANRSVHDAVNMGLHFILQHLDRPGTYVRILFVDFSSAFNKIIPDTLQNKLTQLSVPTSDCLWITSFLTDRQQLVRLEKFSSSTHTISTGAPQGCVLSPLLFSPYTNDYHQDPSVKLLKFADDTTLIGLIQNGDFEESLFVIYLHLFYLYDLSIIIAIQLKLQHKDFKQHLKTYYWEIKSNNWYYY